MPHNTIKRSDGMDRNRAEEIMRSPAKIEVVYDGLPVWIEGTADDKANITVMGTCKTMDVPYTKLRETGKYEINK
jgi:H-type small acid-soluble spore protein